MINHHRKDLRYHIFPVNRLNNSLQYSAITRKPKLTRLFHTSSELQFEETEKFNEFNPHPIPTSNKIKHRTFPRPFVLTSLQFTYTDDPPFGHQLGSRTFYNPTSSLKYKTFS